MTSDVKMQNFVNEITDALIAGENIEPIRANNHALRAESQELIDLIERINHSLVKVEPTPQFSRQLKANLLEEGQYGVVRRFRKLPGRVRVAATAAIVWGFVLILRRIFLGDDHRGEPSEETNALQEKY